AGGGDDSVVLDFGAGLFENAQGGVKFHIDGGAGQDGLTVLGTRGRDVFDLGMKRGVAVINLNGDAEVDAVAENQEEFRVYGRGADDTLNAGGSEVVGAPFAFAVTLSGGDGNDQTVGGAAVTTHEGGAGDDLMVGGPSVDEYVFTGGGLGADTIVDAGGQNNIAIFGDPNGGRGSGFIGPIRLNLGQTTE